MRALRLMTAALVLGLAACGGGDEEQANAPAAEDAASPAAGTAPSAPSSGPATFPRVRPGLWRLVSQDEDGAGEPDEKCVTAQESERMASDPVTALEMSPDCTNQIVREGSAVVVRATCPQGTTAEVRASGDFQNSYQMDVSVRMTTPEPTEIKANIQATRIGDC